MLLVFSCLPLLLRADYHDVPVVDGRQILVYGEPYHVRGVCYSPTPINESMLFGPYGDYFTDEYAFLWRRDFPLLQAMGANSIRIYGWDEDADHGLFLKYCIDYGLRVLITLPLGNAATTPIRGAENRLKVAKRFERQVVKYGEHPAILAWSFGNEINMKEHGFLQEFDREFVCGWNVHDEKHVRHAPTDWGSNRVGWDPDRDAGAGRCAARREGATTPKTRPTRRTRATTRPTASIRTSSPSSTRRPPSPRSTPRCP